MARNGLIVSSKVKSYNYIGGSSMSLARKFSGFKHQLEPHCAFCVTYG